MWLAVELGQRQNTGSVVDFAHRHVIVGLHRVFKKLNLYSIYLKIVFKDWKISCNNTEFLACLKMSWALATCCLCLHMAAGRLEPRTASPSQLTPAPTCHTTWTWALGPASSSLVSSLPYLWEHWSLWPWPGFPGSDRVLHDNYGKDGDEDFLFLCELTAWGFHDPECFR